jgi:hypothetical protein
MNRLLPILGLGLLLATSIAIKVYTGTSASLTGADAGDEDIVALLQRSGFATRIAAPNTDPMWIYGVKSQCKLQIASVSPQGWHSSTVEWEAVGRLLLYSATGRVYRQLPTLKLTTLYYLRRLERYLGMEVSPLRVRAIVIGPACPTDAIAASDLAALS